MNNNAQFTKPHKSKLKARRLRARMANQLNRQQNGDRNHPQQTYSEHLRKTRHHNHAQKKMTQKIKQMSRNDSCPALKPLTIEEKQFIINTVKSNDLSELPISGHLGKEVDDGNCEFKWKLINPGPDRLQHLITQMTYRLGEGGGECIYQIGVEDCGHPRGLCDTQLIESVSTIFLMAKQLGANISISSIKKGTAGKVATLSVKRVIKKQKMEEERKQFLNSDDIRVCVTGNESVGKSTLIGVLTRGKLDDGKGTARMNVFRHRHEIFDGRTSSISHHILGFDKGGTITNYKAFHLSEWNEIVKSSTKLITFVDHPGHERYFKTSVFGLTSHKPHYVLLTVSLDEFDRKQILNKKDKNEKEQEWAQMLSLNLNGLLDGNTSSDDDSNSSSSSDSDDDDDMESVQDITDNQQRLNSPNNEDVKFKYNVNTTMPQKSNDPSSDYHKYLTMCESINVPLFIVITKSDIDKDYNYQRLPKMLDKISTVIANKSHNKLKIKLIETSSEASRAARALSSSVISYIPIIVVSCVNGEGLEILKTFLFSLPSHTKKYSNTLSLNADINGVEFGIDDIYDVDDVGIVTSGIVRNGTVHINDQLSIGPDKDGKYKDITIQSIHVRRKDCSYAFEGQMASLCLKEIRNKEELRRGMVIIDKYKCNADQQTCYSFEAHIDVLNDCRLRENSQPIIHIENIRQSAHILHLHSTDNAALDHGQNGCAVFTFLHHPEFIRCGMKIIIRKSHGPIAVGRVTKILDSADKPLVPLNSLQKPQRLRTSKHKTNFKHYLRKWHLEKQQKKNQSDCDEHKDRSSKIMSKEEIFSTSDDDEVEIRENSDNPSMESIVNNSNMDDDNITNENNHSNSNIQIMNDNPNQHQKDTQCPIRAKTGIFNKSKSRKGRSNKKKKKKFTLVWRSGLGFEHFYPKI